MDFLLDFEEIDGYWEDFSNWDDLELRKKYSNRRNAHQVIKKMWDGYNRPKAMDRGETLLSVSRKDFPNDRDVIKGRPLGPFKDLMVPGATHETIFNGLVQQLTRERTFKDGSKSYLLKEMWYQADVLWEDYFKDVDSNAKYLRGWSRRSFNEAMMLMMYSSSIGILLEMRAHQDLENWLQAYPKAAERFSYEQADSDEWESKDVDGIFRNSKTGKVAVKVSIKTKGAFTERFTKGNYRGTEGKTQPDIYAGYRDPEDSDISFIEVDGKSLKDLLRESIRA